MASLRAKPACAAITGSSSRPLPSIRGAPFARTWSCRSRSSDCPRQSAANARERQLELVNLKGFENKFPWQLSGGMQQRASIARALSFDPKLMLMDEPFGALDEIVRDHLNEQLLQLWAQDGKDGSFRHPFHSGSGVSLHEDRGDVTAPWKDHRYHRCQRAGSRPQAGDPRDARVPEDCTPGPRGPEIRAFL